MESSHAAAGMLAPQAEADRDDAFFKLACASRDLYPAWAERLLAETGVNIELDRTGTIYLALTPHDEEELERRYVWQTKAGLQIERLSAADAHMFEPRLSPDVRMALRFPADGQVEPRRTVTALIAAASECGVQLFTNTEVRSLALEGDAVVRGVETSGGTFEAERVVIAGGAWTSFLFDHVGVRKRFSPPQITPVRGQMLCFAARPPFVRHVIYSPRGYLVPRSDGRLLAGSTTEHAGFDKIVTAAGARAITTNAIEIAPDIANLPLVDSWAGLRPATADAYPVLGAAPHYHNLYFATGHYRNGVLLAPLTALLMADLITEHKDKRATAALQLAPFSPARFAGMGVGN